MQILNKVWKYARWPLFALLLVYIGAVLMEVHWPVSKAKSDAAVAAIQAQRLTMKDVDGSNLPPVPDPVKVNATIEGIDANHNGIRDDVERAIFDKYPNDAKVRAAELQYAKALQMELRNVIDTATFIAVSAKSDRGYFCLSSTALPREVRKARIAEVEALIFNTPERIQQREEIFKDFATSVTGQSESPCDLQL